ncbi:MAG TPA: diaminopimelate epimerase [Rhodospirillaceae bacterium]|nr:diaminopimelate epimerase [Rhodospirillaceae bacterium]
MREFIKMHGLGNDFVIVDARESPLVVSAAGTRYLSDRRTGIGFDQLIALDAPTKPNAEDNADVDVRIFNADGSEVTACGNAMRCVAHLLLNKNASDARLRIRTGAGLLEAWRDTETPINYAVDMGPARDTWQDIPLARNCDTGHLPLTLGPLSDPVGVNIGNPHAVFFVDDITAIPIETLGPALECDPLFPERANIGIAQLTGDNQLQLRVWERGTGLTLACGSGACAAAVAAHRRDLTGRNVQVDVDGGTLNIEWRVDNHVVMSGPAEESFRGAVGETAFLAATNG